MSETLKPESCAQTAAHPTAIVARADQESLEVDPLRCPQCHHEMRIVSLINNAQIIERILRHVGMWVNEVCNHGVRILPFVLQHRIFILIAGIAASQWICRAPARDAGKAKSYQSASDTLLTMINSGRNIVLMLVGVVMVAALVGASQGGAASAKPNPVPAPAAAPAPTSSPLSWAEVLEQNPDPTVVTDADFLKRITETKLPWRVKDKATGMEMLLVPPGKFVMGMSPGDTEAQDDEKPAHEVTITQAFYLGRTEVTQEQWMKVMGLNPSKFQDGSRESLVAKYINEGLTKQEAQERAGAESPNKLLTASNPVETVSWDDCQKFCAKTGMKLPTEAQWEYACRAGVRKPRYGELGQIAWGGENSNSTTHPVAQKAPNALGFYDMLGNVYEWCEDWYEGDYYKSCADGVVDPTGPAQSEKGARVLRGGGWHLNAYFCRASLRFTNAPGYKRLNIGCRFARTP